MIGLTRDGTAEHVSGDQSRTGTVKADLENEEGLIGNHTVLVNAS